MSRILEAYQIMDVDLTGQSFSGQDEGCRERESVRRTLTIGVDTTCYSQELTLAH
jgi:hypothetical protein